jgi:excisionase family DNA binding protein
MFEPLYDLTNTQTVADMLKAQIERSATDSDRSAAMQILQRFERSSWIPQAFEDAVEAAPGDFEFDGDQLVYKPRDNSASEIAAVLARYLELVAPTEQPVNVSDLFTTEQAAEYLKMSVRGVKKNIHETKRLKPARRVGRALLFTREELDRFRNEEDHKPGPKGPRAKK